MKELNEFYESLLKCKSDLKVVYYSFSSEQKKVMVKPLVSRIIKIQEYVKDLMNAYVRDSKARAVLKDKIVILLLKKWSSGLPSRVKTITKYRKMNQDQLHHFAESLMKYLDEIYDTLQKWNNDIKGLDEIPKPPKD